MTRTASRNQSCGIIKNRPQFDLREVSLLHLFLELEHFFLLHQF